MAKCGGTSLSSAIGSLFSPSEKGDWRTNARLDFAAVDHAAQILGRDRLDFNRDLLLYFLASRRHRYVYGHFTFDERAHAEFHRKFAFVTMLRQPIAKWISLYFFNRFKTHEFDKIDTAIDEFVDSPTAAGYGCDYVAQFVGTQKRIDNFASDAAIERAITNLEKFDLVGVLEQLEEFLDDFELLFGVRPKIPHVNANPAPRAERDRQLTPEILQKIEMHCRPNQAIYDHVASKLVSRCKHRSAA